jgi:hypothetical protein
LAAASARFWRSRRFGDLFPYAELDARLIGDVTQIDFERDVVDMRDLKVSDLAIAKHNSDRFADPRHGKKGRYETFARAASWVLWASLDDNLALDHSSALFVGGLI